MRLLLLHRAGMFRVGDVVFIQWASTWRGVEVLLAVGPWAWCRTVRHETPRRLAWAGAVAAVLLTSLVAWRLS